MTLQPGETYTVQVTVTNRSQYAGEPVAADLTIAIEAALNGVELIPYEDFGDWYEPDEAKTHAWQFTVPAEIATSSGAIVVEVRDPNGWRIARASAPIDVVGEEAEPEPEPEPEELTITDIFLADLNDPDLPGRGIWAILDGVVPDGREFYTQTRARRIAPTTGTTGANRTLSFLNGVPRYMNLMLSSGRTYEWVSVDIYDYLGGTLLASRRLEFDPPYYQE